MKWNSVIAQERLEQLCLSHRDAVRNDLEIILLAALKGPPADAASLYLRSLPKDAVSKAQVADIQSSCDTALNYGLAPADC